MRQRLCAGLDGPVDPAGIGPAPERGGLVRGLEAKHREAVLCPPHQPAAGHLVVRSAAMIGPPVARVLQAHLVGILAVIVGNDFAVWTRHDARL